MDPNHDCDDCSYLDIEWDDPWRSYDFDSGEGEYFFLPGADRRFNVEEDLVGIVINYEERAGFENREPARTPG
uniref:Putative P7 protein n=1 Tax=Cytorhabdovirus fragariae TaxID=2676436 RepID=A0A650ACS6_9RHAB|nr:putative P7 protein [Cytorhabdovirus fragariae]